VIADLPNWADVQFLRSASGAFVVGGVLLALVLLFAIRSITRKLFAILVIGACIFGLVHYRQTLEHCNDKGCACKLFGQTVVGGRKCTNANVSGAVPKQP
jgi:disulfide bond formation protein DsbB